MRSKGCSDDITQTVPQAIGVVDLTIHHKDDEHVRKINELENLIDEKERELQQKHIDRLTQNECTPGAGMIFSDVVSGLERVADHATNITHSIANIEE